MSTANERGATLAGDAGAVFHLTIRAVKDGLGRPAQVRLRLALKVLLRRFALRCAEIRQEGEGEGSATQ
ncbi:MAG: hypothetical protein HY719_14980 [Planctomycetes bacterium]|nr:hypothetical protein [Planctomycetota bacterium]